jgi:hypothetical protein
MSTAATAAGTRRPCAPVRNFTVDRTRSGVARLCVLERGTCNTSVARGSCHRAMSCVGASTAQIRTTTPSAPTGDGAVDRAILQVASLRTAHRRASSTTISSRYGNTAGARVCAPTAGLAAVSPRAPRRNKTVNSTRSCVACLGVKKRGTSDTSKSLRISNSTMASLGTSAACVRT